jgi:hypothetical protein
MNKEKEKFDTVTLNIIFGQLFKSKNTMLIVHLKTESLAVHNASKVYFQKLEELLLELTKVSFGIAGRKMIDEIPHSKYIDPEHHLNDIYFYLNRYKDLFKSQEESNIIGEILKLISKTKLDITLR